MHRGSWIRICCLFFSVEAGFIPRTRLANTKSLLAVSSQHDLAADVDEQFDKFLEEWFDEFMAAKPMEALRFGRQLPACRALAAKKATRVDQIWGNPSAAAEAEGVQRDQQRLKDMQQRFGASIGARDLSDERHVTYILLDKKVEEMRKEHLYRGFRPPFGPLGCQIGVMGCQVQVVGMIRGLAINNVDDARCYVVLLNGLPDFLMGHGRRLQDANAGRKAVHYRQVLEAVTKDCDAKLRADGNATSQDEGIAAQSNVLFKAFDEKLRKATGISDEDKHVLLKAAEKGVVDGVWPAYRGLREIIQGLLPKSIESSKGLSANYGDAAREFYDYRVQLLGVGGDTQSLHERALKLVQENAKLIRQRAAEAFPASSGANSSSPALVMKALRKPYTEARYENTESGRASYLKDVRGDIKVMQKRLQDTSDANAQHRLFYPSDIPVLPCEVQRIQSPTFPGLAQYSPGSLGSTNRSAVVRFNVYDMSKVSKMDMEVLAYHEVVPGHHLQVTKALTLPLPSFRRYFGDEAFAEGWAVYAEQDISPRLVNLSSQSHLGRLNLLQTRAVRMAVDTGIHALGWDRKRAEAFYIEHTMITPERAVQAVDRHFSWPAQALTYAAGYEAMKKLRNSVISKHGLVDSLGKDWEAMLHKAILSHGDLPLAMLEKVVFSQLHAWRSRAAPSQSFARHQNLLSAVTMSIPLLSLANLLIRSTLH